MNRRKFLRGVTAVPLIATTPSLLAQAASKPPSPLAPLNLSNQDSPTSTDRETIDAVVAAIPKTPADALGDLYDSHIYPAALVATKNALRTGDIEWTRLLVNIYQASESLSVEGIDALLEEVIMRARAVPRNGTLMVCPQQLLPRSI